MPYTETQKRGKNIYYYLTHSMRVDGKFKKVRVFLGANLTKEKLEREGRHKASILQAKISAVEESSQETFNSKISFSKKILAKQQLERIKKSKLKYHKKIKLADKDVLRKVRESFLVKYTYHTNASEGNTISLKEAELIIKKGIVPRSHSLREVHEIENTVKAYNFIEEYKGPLDHKFILKIHKLVTQNTLENKNNEGKYRKKGQNVVMTGSEHFPPKGGREIKRLILALIEKYEKSKLSKIEKAIQFHSEFILIHPFIDGNGRVSRLLFNWMMIKEDLPPLDFPTRNHIEYTDLMEVSRDGDSKPLAEYIYNQLLESFKLLST